MWINLLTTWLTSCPSDHWPGWGELWAQLILTRLRERMLAKNNVSVEAESEKESAASTWTNETPSISGETKGCCKTRWWQAEAPQRCPLGWKTWWCSAHTSCRHMCRISIERSYYHDRRTLHLWSCLAPSQVGAVVSVAAPAGQASFDIDECIMGESAHILCIVYRTFNTYVECVCSLFVKYIYFFFLLFCWMDFPFN